VSEKQRGGGRPNHKKAAEIAVRDRQIVEAYLAYLWDCVGGNRKTERKFFVALAHEHGRDESVLRKVVHDDEIGEGNEEFIRHKLRYWRNYLRALSAAKAMDASKELHALSLIRDEAAKRLKKARKKLMEARK